MSSLDRHVNLNKSNAKLVVSREEMQLFTVST